MTSPTEKNPLPHAEQAQEFDLERIKRLVSDLEQDLAKAPADIPNLQDLKKELAEFRQTLASSSAGNGGVRDRLHGIRASLKKITATVEGEVLMDTPYITEVGRILGLV
jgi:hypothetical protein